MTQIQGFAPVADANTRILILGTAPSEISLREGRYYANPRNSFWRVVGTLCGFDPALPYERAVAEMLRGGIGIWDVAVSCSRLGSMDADIDDSTVVPNDIASFIMAHRHLHCVATNGGKADRLYRTHIVPTLPHNPAMRYVCLPSTSSANTISFERKLAAWRKALGL